MIIQLSRRMSLLLGCAEMCTTYFQRFTGYVCIHTHTMFSKERDTYREKTHKYVNCQN